MVTRREYWYCQNHVAEGYKNMGIEDMRIIRSLILNFITQSSINTSRNSNNR